MYACNFFPCWIGMFSCIIIIQCPLCRKTNFWCFFQHLQWFPDETFSLLTENKTKQNKTKQNKTKQNLLYQHPWRNLWLYRCHTRIFTLDSNWFFCVMSISSWFCLFSGLVWQWFWFGGYFESVYLGNLSHGTNASCAPFPKILVTLFPLIHLCHKCHLVVCFLPTIFILQWSRCFPPHLFHSYSNI